MNACTLTKLLVLRLLWSFGVSKYRFWIQVVLVIVSSRNSSVFKKCTFSDYIGNAKEIP